MKASELREKSIEELDSLLVELRREQFNMRMQKGTGQMNNPHHFKRVKKDVARINTIKKEMASA
ncbi:MAG: 50S ribosomal protein L29 [Gammaproteobacteria bacterium]|nr:MAG: 50S ribosomal protein L29 [Gammaproteobacteria bacterium]RLA24309.1 MAG: 50S ribosomal protein L29 [Gammaproteobacteria bacterium]